MKIDESAPVSAPIDDVWSLVTDVPRVGACLPGAEGVIALPDGRFGGTVRVKVGAIGVSLDGKVRLVEQDESRRRAVLEIEASDRRIRGAVTAQTVLTLQVISAQSTMMTVSTEAVVAGKLGQFGQAVIAKKTRQILDEFVANVGRELTGLEGPAPVGAEPGQSPDATGAPDSSVASSYAAAARSRGPRVTQASTSLRDVAVLALTAGGLLVGLVAAMNDRPQWSTFGLTMVVSAVVVRRIVR